MGLLSTILFFPVTGPVAGIRWSLDKVMRVVREELTDDSAVKQELMELQLLLELGDIDEAEYLRREAELVDYPGVAAASFSSASILIDQRAASGESPSNRQYTYTNRSRAIRSRPSSSSVSIVSGAST